MGYSRLTGAAALLALLAGCEASVDSLAARGITCNWTGLASPRLMDQGILRIGSYLCDNGQVMDRDGRPVGQIVSQDAGQVTIDWTGADHQGQETLDIVG